MVQLEADGDRPDQLLVHDPVRSLDAAVDADPAISLRLRGGPFPAPIADRERLGKAVEQQPAGLTPAPRGGHHQRQASRSQTAVAIAAYTARRAVDALHW